MENACKIQSHFCVRFLIRDHRDPLPGGGERLSAPMRHFLLDPRFLYRLGSSRHISLLEKVMSPKQ